MMSLYLSKAAVPGSKGDTGDIKGGKFVARTQTGYTKEGKTQYRYFNTQEEYQAFLEQKKKSGKEKKDKGPSRLDDKQKKEQKSGKKKAKESRALLVGKQSKAKVKKSLSLYVRREK